MRVPTYLSNSALMLCEKNLEEFYLKYLSERRPPRTPQERPAAAGSAFDAYVKAALCRDLGVFDPKYSLDALFEAQVEPQNRDWAREQGRYVFDCYEASGFYDSIREELEQSSEPPRFEFTVEAVLNGVPFLGKPDGRWVTPGKVHVVHDWKVNGFCSKSTTSPHKSYQLCRDAYTGKQSKSHDTSHKEFLGCLHGDLLINTTYMEAANPAWADQLSLYGWALGEKIGDENVVLSIHQIVAKPNGERPQLRVAQYRARVKASYQLALAERLKKCWDSITGGHIFSDMSRADSDARCAILDDAAAGLQSDKSSREEFFNEAVRKPYRG